MLPDQVSNPGPLTYESGPLSIAPRGLAEGQVKYINFASTDYQIQLKIGNVG